MNLEEASGGIEEGKVRFIARVEETGDFLKLEDFPETKIEEILKKYGNLKGVSVNDSKIRASFYIVDSKKKIVYYSRT